MSVIMTYLLRFLCLCNYKIGYGSAWSNWKQVPGTERNVYEWR